MQKIDTNNLIIKTDQQTLWVNLNRVDGKLVTKVKKLKSKQQVESYLNANGPKPAVFSKKHCPVYDDCPNGLTLFVMAMIPCQIKGGRKSQADDRSWCTAFYNSTDDDQNLINGIIRAYAHLREVLTAHTEIEQTYWLQEHLVQYCLNVYANPRLGFRIDALCRIKSTIIEKRTRILNYASDLAGQPLDPNKPMIKQLQRIPELRARHLTMVNFFNSNMGGQESTMTEYALDSLKADALVSQVANDLLWVYTDCAKWLADIERIERNGYSLIGYLQNYAASTGRIYCYCSNVLGFAKVLRHTIEIPKGFVLTSLDYSCHEPGIFAGYTKGEALAMIEAAGDDIYTVVGGAVNQLTKAVDIRDSGKTLVTALINGITPVGIAHTFSISRTDAEAVYSLLSNMFAESMKNMAAVRNRYFDGTMLRYSCNGMSVARPMNIRQSEVSLNKDLTAGIVQGTSSLILKAVLLELPGLLMKYDITFLFPVHDSLILLVPERCRQEAVAAVKELMDETVFSFVGYRSDRIRAKIETDWARERPLRQLSGIGGGT